jgi:hypothetical protein
VVTKRLIEAERLVQEQMLAMPEWASDHPKQWHNIGKLEATKKAAELLAKRGVIEIWPGNESVSLKACVENLVVEWPWLQNAPLPGGN